MFRPLFIASTFLAAPALVWQLHAQKVYEFDAFLGVLPTLMLVEEEQMDFGVIERPTQTVNLSVNHRDFLNRSSSANSIDTSTVKSGKYRVYASNAASIQFSGSDVGNIPGMNFTDLRLWTDKDGQGRRGFYRIYKNGTSYTKTGFTNMDQQLVVMAATLQVEPEVESGTYYPAFIIEANYE